MGDVVQSFFRKECLMRCDDHVRHGDQAHQLIILDDIIGEIFVEQIAFFFVNVQACATDNLDFQTIDQRLCIDLAATGSVDDHDTGLHLLDSIVIDHMAGLICQRAMQRDDIGMGQKFRKVNVVEIAVCGRELVIS